MKSSKANELKFRIKQYKKWLSLAKKRDDPFLEQYWEGVLEGIKVAKKFYETPKS